MQNTKGKQKTKSLDNQAVTNGKEQLNETSNDTDEQHKSRGSSLLETILHNGYQSNTSNKTIASDQVHSNSKNDVNTSGRTSTSSNRQPKTAIVRPQIYQRTFSNFRSSSSCSNEEESETTMSNPSMTGIIQPYKQQLNSVTTDKSLNQRIRELVPVCKNPKAVVRKRSLQCKSALGLKSDGCTSPPPRSTRPKTVLTGSRSLPIENSRSLVPYNGQISRNELESRRASSAPVSRVLTLMERDQLATQFIHVGHRALVDLGKKKSKYQENLQLKSSMLGMNSDHDPA